MFQENEVITLLITFGIGIFLVINQKSLSRFHRWKLLFTAFLFYLGSAVFTVAEDISWESGFNFLEHAASLCFSILFLFWCWRVGFSKENAL